MPKGGRKKGTPDKEVDEAAERMRKHKESLQSARDSESWLNFLADIGVNPDILSSSSGQGFWESVRQKIDEPIRSNIIDNLSMASKGDTKEIREKADRRSGYSIARYFGASARESRKVRDWSDQRLAEYLGFENYVQMLKEIYK